MPKEFLSFYKEVAGGEGDHCKYPTRLDTYGCGCYHNCNYCYARSLLDFRKNWNPEDPHVADIKKIATTLDKIPSGSVIRLGGMTDCFQPCEDTYHVTRETLKLMNNRGIEGLIVTKSHTILDCIDLLKNHHVQVSLTFTKENPYGERASTPEQRIQAIEKLSKAGIDTQIRLSPYFPQFHDLEVVNKIKCDRAIVEFLRVSGFTKKWLKVSDKPFTVKSGGYSHLPIEVKYQLAQQIKKEVSVCEDVDEHYQFWVKHFNPNKEDCCNLRR